MIYDVKNPISLIFRGPQAPHIATIFEIFLQTILFYANKIACHILDKICEPSRITNHGVVFLCLLPHIQMDRENRTVALFRCKMAFLKWTFEADPVSVQKRTVSHFNPKKDGGGVDYAPGIFKGSPPCVR